MADVGEFAADQDLEVCGEAVTMKIRLFVNK